MPAAYPVVSLSAEYFCADVKEHSASWQILCF